MGKYRHELRVNETKKRTKDFLIDIDRTKRIKLQIAKDYIQITAELSKRLAPEDILADKSRVFHIV